MVFLPAAFKTPWNYFDAWKTRVWSGPLIFFVNETFIKVNPSHLSSGQCKHMHISCPVFSPITHTTYHEGMGNACSVCLDPLDWELQDPKRGRGPDVVASLWYCVYAHFVQKHSRWYTRSIRSGAPFLIPRWKAIARESRWWCPPKIYTNDQEKLFNYHQNAKPTSD